MSEQNCGCHNEKVDIQNISSFAACGQGQFHPAGDEVRHADAKIDFVCPEVPFPSKRICAIVGADKIREMVFYHHTLLRNSVVGGLFPSDDEMFKMGTEKTAEFFIEALGGGEVYTPKHGHPALRMRHFPFTIDENARVIWLMSYKKTLKDIEFPKELIEEFWNWIEPLSIRMINRRTTAQPPQRYHFSHVKSEFGL